jgi:hypothetical protein
MKKLKASTLIETIVALTILAVVFMISISIILNSMWFSKPNLKEQALKMSKQVTYETLTFSDYSNLSYTANGLMLVKEIEEIQNGLLNLKLQVWYNDSTLILSNNRYILANEKD